MNYDFKKIINRNRKEFSDCQVVTAVNAYYLLTGNVIEQDSDEYLELVKLAKAENGAAISIKKVWQKLELEVTQEKIWPNSDELTSPTELTIWYKRCGFHSVLAYDYVPKCEAFRVSNLPWLTTHNGWIFWEDLHQIMKGSLDGSHWMARSFRLAGQEIS